MLSDQLDCKDSEDPLKLREFVKTYASNGSNSASSLFRSLNNLIVEESSSIIEVNNQNGSNEDVEMEEENKGDQENHLPQNLKQVGVKLQQSFVQVMFRFV